MFYESERIIRKQQKYEKMKANDIINKLKSKNLSKIEMINAINILLKDDNTEFKQDILNRVKVMLNNGENK